jgi:hypothetical protein
VRIRENEEGGRHGALGKAWNNLSCDLSPVACRLRVDVGRAMVGGEESGLEVSCSRPYSEGACEHGDVEFSGRPSG